MVVVAVKYRARRGMGDRVEKALSEMMPLARAEPGCRLFEVARSDNDPDSFFLYERYVDETAVEAHRETDHFKRIILEHVIPMLDERKPEVYRLLGS